MVRDLRGSPLPSPARQARYTVQQGEAKAAKSSNGHAGWNPSQPQRLQRRTLRFEAKLQKQELAALALQAFQI
jgi:hypothetical protein